MACVQGYASRLSINGVQMPFIKVEDLSYTELVDNGDLAIRGRLNHPKERVTIGRQINKLRVTMNPSPTQLTTLLPLFGFSLSGGVYGLGDTLTTFTTVVDKISKIHTFSNCVMGQAVLSGQRGAAPIQLAMDIYATAIAEGSSFGSPTAMDTDIVYAFHEGSLTIGGSAVAFDRFSLMIDPHPEVQWNNSRQATQICWTNRNVELSTSIPYGSGYTGFLTTPLGDASGVSGTLGFTRGSQSESIAITNMKSIARPPSIIGKGQIRLPATYRCFYSTSGSTVTPTIQWTHTP